MWLGGKSAAEKVKLLQTMRAECDKSKSASCFRVSSFRSFAVVFARAEAVESLEKLMGFYAKDPVGAKATQGQLATEREQFASLTARVAELEASLAHDEQRVDDSTVTDTESELDGYDDNDDDDFNVDALGAALRSVLSPGARPASRACRVVFVSLILRKCARKSRQRFRRPTRRSMWRRWRRLCAAPACMRTRAATRRSAMRHISLISSLH